MALLSKEELKELFVRLRDLPEEDGVVLKSLLDRDAISDAQLAADLSLPPSSVMTSVHRLKNLGLVNLNMHESEQRSWPTVQLSSYGVEAASLLRSLAKLEL